MRTPLRTRSFLTAVNGVAQYRYISAIQTLVILLTRLKDKKVCSVYIEIDYPFQIQIEDMIRDALQEEGAIVVKKHVEYVSECIASCFHGSFCFDTGRHVVSHAT